MVLCYVTFVRRNVLNCRIVLIDGLKICDSDMAYLKVLSQSFPGRIKKYFKKPLHTRSPGRDIISGARHRMRRVLKSSAYSTCFLLKSVYNLSESILRTQPLQCAIYICMNFNLFSLKLEWRKIATVQFKIFYLPSIFPSSLLERVIRTV